MKLQNWKLPAAVLCGVLLLLGAWGFVLPSGNRDLESVIDALAQVGAAGLTQPVHVNTIRDYGGSELPWSRLYHPFNWNRRFNESFLDQPGPLGKTGSLEGELGTIWLSVLYELDSRKHEICANLKLQYEIWSPDELHTGYDNVNYGIAAIDVHCADDKSSDLCLSVFQTLRSELPDISVRMQPVRDR